MIDAVVGEPSVNLSKRYEFQAEHKYSKTLQIDSQIQGNALISSKTRNPWDTVSSSSCVGTFEKVLILRLIPTTTESQINLLEYCADPLQAEERVSSVRVKNASENLFELRRLTGFTWIQLANLLNVTRRALYNWLKGAMIREKNREHIAETLKVLRFVDRGSAELNASALYEQILRYEFNSIEAIKTGNYELAKRHLAQGHSRPNKFSDSVDPVKWIGEFQPMLMHADADGNELIEPLPNEPEPKSRKRSIRRG